jgi:hypothetical protein
VKPICEVRKGILMSTPRTTIWISAGLLALPLYSLLTIWSTFDAQPDQVKEPEAWARYVGSTSYLVDHMLGANLGAILAIFGVFALGAYLTSGSSGRLGMVAMVMTVLGQALFLVVGGVSTFALHAIGQAYLAGTTEVMQVEFSSALAIILLLSILLAFVGSLLLGIAIWRSGTLPKWAGVLWAASGLMFYVLGAVLGMATTGSSLLTQPIAASLIVISGGWIAWSVIRQPSTSVVRVRAQPVVQ